MVNKNMVTSQAKIKNFVHIAGITAVLGDYTKNINLNMALTITVPKEYGYGLVDDNSCKKDSLRIFPATSF